MMTMMYEVMTPESETCEWSVRWHRAVVRRRRCRQQLQAPPSAAHLGVYSIGWTSYNFAYHSLEKSFYSY